LNAVQYIVHRTLGDALYALDASGLKVDCVGLSAQLPHALETKLFDHAKKTPTDVSV
jgi:hypothetical protein